MRTGQADRDGKGYITVEDAFDYAADRVNETGAQQEFVRNDLGVRRVFTESGDKES